MIVVFGASGHAKEIAYIIANTEDKSKNVSFFIDNLRFLPVGGIPVLSENHLVEDIGIQEQNDYCAYVGIGDGFIRKRISDKFGGFDNLTFPNLVAFGGGVALNRVSLKEGNVFFPGVNLTVDTEIGRHNHFNLDSTISHDCRIGDFNTLSPGVRFAGNVKIGNNNFFGVNACVIDKVTIGNNTIIGAGSVVIADILEAGTYVGIPAKRIK